MPATPTTDGEFTNAALVLARDLLQLDGLFAERSHPVLGRTTATPTMLEAGVSRNVTPPVAKAVLDIRSTPDWTHDEMADVLRRSLRSEVVVTSQTAGAVRDAGRVAAARRRAAGATRSRRRSAARPAPTGSSSGTPTRSSAGPAPAAGRTRPTSTWICPR